MGGVRLGEEVVRGEGKVGKIGSQRVARLCQCPGHDPFLVHGLLQGPYQGHI